MKEFLEKNHISFKQIEPLKNHTSFKIGGKAKYFIEPEDISQLKALLTELKRTDTPYIILGRGSNLLVSDGEIEKAVIHLSGTFDKIELIDETTIMAGAAASVSSLCFFALEHELTGLEFAYGIPGSVGGGVYMNAGAYGGQLSDVVTKVSHITPSGESGTLEGEELHFDYRKSAYSESGNIITCVLFSLKKGVKSEIQEKMTDILSRRKSKQPLEYPSAGSVFKRPQGYFAGALIEQSGLKGKSVGGAQVSEKHAGFIINKGGASCKDVLDLIEICQKTVKEKFGVMLETEIKMI